MHKVNKPSDAAIALELVLLFDRELAVLRP
jgi:hypothetical protein